MPQEFVNASMRVDVIANTGPVAASYNNTPDMAAGANAATIFTAVATGSAGNDITVEYVDPGAPGAVLGIVVVGTAITVNLATDGGGVITTVGGDITAAINLDPAASLLVGAADAGTGLALVSDYAAKPLAGGDDGIRLLESYRPSMDLEIQNTSQAVVYFKRESDVSAANGYPLAPMSGAATFDGGRYKTTKYNGQLYFYSAAASSVRVVRVG